MISHSDQPIRGDLTPAIPEDGGPIQSARRTPPPPLLADGLAGLRRLIDEMPPDDGPSPVIDYSSPEVQAQWSLIWRMDAAGIPRRLQDKRVRTYQPATEGARIVRQAVIAYLTDYPNLQPFREPTGLLLYGAPGSGKTHLAVAALIAMIERGANGRYECYPDLLGEIKATYGKNERGDETETNLIQALVEVDVLLIDDLGAGKATDWAAEKAYQIINGRYSEGKTTLITTNLAYPTPLDSVVDCRVISRLAEMCRIYGMVEPAGVDMEDWRMRSQRG